MKTDVTSLLREAFESLRRRRRNVCPYCQGGKMIALPLAPRPGVGPVMVKCTADNCREGETMISDHEVSRISACAKAEALHDVAMSLFDKALEQRKAGNVGLARVLYGQAAIFERRAAGICGGLGSEESRVVLTQSAENLEELANGEL